MLPEQTKAELYNKLFSRRKEILEQTRTLRDSWRDVNYSEIEFADRSQLETTYQSLEHLDEQGRKEIQVIDRALDKMQSSNYGLCESCGQEISVARLQALPWAALCNQCIKISEQEQQPVDPAEVIWHDDRHLNTSYHGDEDLEDLSDLELQEIILDRVHEGDRIETDELEITCEDSVVYLDGVLPNELQYNLLLAILQDSLGLENIVDNLRIDSVFRLGPQGPSDIDDDRDITDDDLFLGDEDPESY